jgi:integrase/DNA-directed RNA polymerase subunit RPC12/RpoP
MSINRICSRCKRTFSLQTAACPHCRHLLAKFKVRLERQGRWLTRVVDSLEAAQAAEAEFRGRGRSSNKAEPRSRKGPAKALDPRPSPTAEPQEQTLGQIWPRYLAYVSDRNRSWEDDRGRWTHHIEHKLGHLTLDQITPLIVCDLTPTDSLRSTRLSPATRHRVFSLLRRLINWSVKRRLWAGPNPCAALEGVGSYENSRHRYLTDPEQARLLAAIDAEPNRRVALVVKFLWASGRRRGETLKLEWSDIDLQAGTATFRHTKNGRVQRVPLNRHALEVLSQAMETRIGNLCFPCESGRFFHSFNRGWLRIRESAGLVGFHLHDLRSNFASRLASSGKADILSVSKLLGHSGIDITVKRYAALFDQRLREASEMMA